MAASISFQATDTDNGTIGSGSSYTFPLTVASAAGQERLVAISGICSPATGCDFSPVTIDGQTGTRVGSVVRGSNDGGNACAVVTVYRANGTANTSINVVATVTGATAFSGYCALWTLTDADTLLASTNAITNDPSLNTNTATDGVAVAALFAYGDTSPAVVWTGLTENFDSVAVFANDVFSGASAAISSGATPRTISANITPDLNSGGSGDSIAAICVSFNPDAGGGTTLTAAAGSYALTGTNVVENLIMPLGAAGA